MTIPLTDAPRVDAGRGPVLFRGDDPPEPRAGGGWPGDQAAVFDRPAAWPDRTAAAWPDRSAFWADDLAPCLPSFVGRARELERLDRLLADAAAGRPRIAVVEGEAGLGKSSLITEFLSRHQEVPVLAASGEMSEQALPWGLVRQLARRADSDVVGGWGDDPRRAFPLLVSGPPANADPLSVGEELVALFAAHARAEERATEERATREGGASEAGMGRRAGPRGERETAPSARGGLAVVVEDLQWADQPSARALLFACRRLACDKVLVILSARQQELSRLGDGWSRFLAGDRRCSRLALARLSGDELAELAAACGRAGLSGRALARIADHSGGHPQFAWAMLSELPDHVLEGPEDGLYLPRSLSAVILPRLATLPGAARNLVIAAAVLGETCAVGDAAVLAGMPQSDNALDQAVAAGFLVTLPEQRGLAFAHELIRRAVYRDIGTARRRSLHRWAAAMADGPESLRHRVAAAAGTDLALALELDAAAAAAAGSGEPACAAAYHLQAAQLGARGPERDGRVMSALELLVQAADAAGADALRPVAEQLPASARRDAALGQLAMLMARPAAAERLLLAAWAAHDREEPTDPAAGAEASAGLALIYGNAASPDECRSWSRRSVQVSRGGGNLPAASRAAQAMARAVAGETAAALRMVSFLPDAPALVPDAHADALTVRGMLRLWTGDEPGADDDLSAVVGRIKGGLRPRYPGQALGYLGETAFRLGRWEEAKAHAELALCLADEAGRPCDLPFAHNVACVVAAFRGEWEQACGHAASAERAARAAGTRSAMLFAAAARGALGFARDDAAEVLRGVPSGSASQPPCSFQDPTISLWRPARIWALIRVARLDEADTALDALEPGDDAHVIVHAARLRASAALARGEAEQAVGILEACTAVADGLHNPFALALFDVEYGRCLARSHRRPAALTRLRSAHEVLARLGARPFADAVAAELAALGLRGGPDPDSALAGLTAQELQVARLVADGLSNREAAARLYLSPKTIEYHLAHIFAKLGVRTRYQLAARLRPGRPGDPPGHPAS